MNKLFTAHLALGAVALLYGSNYSVAKLVLDDGFIGPLGFIWMRVFAGLVLFTITHHFFIKEKVDRADVVRLLLCAVFGVAVNMSFFFVGLKHTTPINASLIMTTTPILVLIVSAFMIGERITPRKLFGISLGAVGAIGLLAYGQDLSFNQQQLLGDVLVFLNAMSYGIYLVLVKRLMEKYHPITVLRWAFTFGIFMVTPLGIGEVHSVDWDTFTNVAWFGLVYVLIGTTFLTYLFNAYALKMVNPSVVSIYIYLQPVIAAILSILLGQDQLTSVKLIAGALIFAGVYLVSTQKKTHRVTSQ